MPTKLSCQAHFLYNNFGRIIGTIFNWSVIFPYQGILSKNIPPNKKLCLTKTAWGVRGPRLRGGHHPILPLFFDVAPYDARWNPNLLSRENVDGHAKDESPEHVKEAPTRPSFSYSDPVDPASEDDEPLQFIDEINNIQNILRKPSIGKPYYCLIGPLLMYGNLRHKLNTTLPLLYSLLMLLLLFSSSLHCIPAASFVCQEPPLYSSSLHCMPGASIVIQEPPL